MFIWCHSKEIKILKLPAEFVKKNSDQCAFKEYLLYIPNSLLSISSSKTSETKLVNNNLLLIFDTYSIHFLFRNKKND